MKKSSYLFLLSLFALASCKTVFNPSPYKAYVRSLESSGLDKTVMGKAWITAGENAVAQPDSDFSLPFKAEIFFQKATPAAVGYRISYSEASKLTFKIKTNGTDSSGVFVSLMKTGSVSAGIIDKTVRGDTVFLYENGTNNELILRIQPQLLVNQYVTIEIFENPKLAFPVQNGVNRDIKSFWGNNRDGGSRKHEGVDIFNKRGTPVVAVENGIISRVQLTNLGGKVVWQRLGLLGKSIYYAHLDSQLVVAGQTVKRGEVIGLMGNTGNARTTPPHLHFGIYAAGGAIDPINYIATKDTIPGRLLLNENFLGKELIVKENGAVVPVEVVSVSTKNVGFTDYLGNFRTDKKPDTRTGSIKGKPADATEFILDQPSAAGTPIARFQPKKNYSLAGYTETHLYIEQNDVKGWIRKE